MMEHASYIHVFVLVFDWVYVAWFVLSFVILSAFLFESRGKSSMKCHTHFILFTFLKKLPAPCGIRTFGIGVLVVVESHNAKLRDVSVDIK